MRKSTAGLIALAVAMSLIVLSCAGGSKSGDVWFGSSYDVVIIGVGGAVTRNDFVQKGCPAIAVAALFYNKEVSV